MKQRLTILRHLLLVVLHNSPILHVLKVVRPPDVPPTYLRLAPLPLLFQSERPLHGLLQVQYGGSSLWYLKYEPLKSLRDLISITYDNIQRTFRVSRYDHCYGLALSYGDLS